MSHNALFRKYRNFSSICFSRYLIRNSLHKTAYCFKKLSLYNKNLKVPLKDINYEVIHMWNIFILECFCGKKTEKPIRIYALLMRRAVCIQVLIELNFIFEIEFVTIKVELFIILHIFYVLIHSLLLLYLTSTLLF